MFCQSREQQKKSLWYSRSPIFNNYDLFIGKHPITFGQCRQCYDKGIHSLGDIMGDIIHLKNVLFNLTCRAPPFILRTAEGSHEDLWMAPLKDHHLLKVLCETQGTRGLVSKFYVFFWIKCIL